MKSQKKTNHDVIAVFNIELRIGGEKCTDRTYEMRLQVN